MNNITTRFLTLSFMYISDHAPYLPWLEATYLAVNDIWYIPDTVVLKTPV